MFSWQARVLHHSFLCRLLCFGHGIGNGRGLAYHVVLATHKILILHSLPDNLPPAVTPLFALPDHHLILLEGPDATAFAQAQFANDVVALSPGHWQWNAWLTPKGRVIALFALVKQEEGRLLLVVPDADSAELAAQLQRFVFRRKLKVAIVPEWQVAGSFTQPALAESARIAVGAAGLELDYGSAAAPRSLQLVPASADIIFDADASARWHVCDLQHGLPRLTADQREQWTPQQISLERLRAFSVKKGCYPGQEIVARTHFLGKAKRGLALFQANADINAGTEVQADGSSIGKIVSHHASKGLHWLLAVMPLENESASYNAAGIPLHKTALLDGMQR